MLQHTLNIVTIVITGGAHALISHGLYNLTPAPYLSKHVPYKYSKYSPGNAELMIGLKTK